MAYRAEVLRAAGAIEPEAGLFKKDLSPFERKRIGVYSALDWIERTQPQIPRDVLTETREIVDRIYREFENPEDLRRNANIDPEAKLGAFLVHSRRTEGCHSHLDDVGRCLPALAQRYSVPERVVESVWHSLPTFRIGDMTGTLGGKNIHIVELSTQVSPGKLRQLGEQSTFKRVTFARGKIEESTRFAQNIGCKVVGLGEILASLTDHGRFLQRLYPELKIVTGHSMTTASIMKRVENAVKSNGSTFSDTIVAIIGANGSIGSSVTRLLASRGIGGLVLHEKEGESMQRHLERVTSRLETEFPHLEGRISTNTGDHRLKETFSGASIVVSAASVSEPFIKAEMIKNGRKKVILIDDGQPPAITLDEARRANISVEWPVVEIEELRSDFDYGIGEDTWPCEAEVGAVLAGYDLKTVGPVDKAMVIDAEKAWKDLGFRISRPQYFGHYTTSIDTTPAFA